MDRCRNSFHPLSYSSTVTWIELGIGLMQLGIDLRISNARRTVLARVSGLVSRGQATLHLAVSVGRSVRWSVGPSVTFLNSKLFSHYCSCPTVRDWIAVFPALFL